MAEVRSFRHLLCPQTTAPSRACLEVCGLHAAAVEVSRPHATCAVGPVWRILRLDGWDGEPRSGSRDGGGGPDSSGGGGRRGGGCGPEALEEEAAAAARARSRPGPRLTRRRPGLEGNTAARATGSLPDLAARKIGGWRRRGGHAARIWWRGCGAVARRGKGGDQARGRRRRWADECGSEAARSTRVGGGVALGEGRRRRSRPLRAAASRECRETRRAEGGKKKALGLRMAVVE
ncbi:hypothetical protein BS78_05G250500 [Paspalum vaginatum]|nr:hypothetical protein BS78_05G250500 [Paspalum vaginatum]KAJ1276882.1 hypothetical protein BS78_05G250500 [Paspalum vaginatum]